MGKRDILSDPKIVLEVDSDACTVILPEKFEKLLTVALEDIRLALTDDSLEQVVHTSLDNVAISIDYFTYSKSINRSSYMLPDPVQTITDQ